MALPKFLDYHKSYEEAGVTPAIPRPNRIVGLDTVMEIYTKQDTKPSVVPDTDPEVTYRIFFVQLSQIVEWIVPTKELLDTIMDDLTAEN